MIGAILGLAMSAASTAIGAAKNAQTARKQEQNIAADEAANEAYRNRYMNEDPLARAGNRRLMEQQMQNVERLNRAAAGTQAVVGGTDESVAAQRENNSKALADTAGQVAASQDARRDAVDRQYMANRGVISQDKNNLYVTRMNNVAEAVKAAGNTASSVATSLDSELDGKFMKKDNNTSSDVEEPSATVEDDGERFSGERKVQGTAYRTMKIDTKSGDPFAKKETPFEKPFLSFEDAANGITWRRSNGTGMRVPQMKSLAEISGDPEKWNRLNDNVNRIRVGSRANVNEQAFEDWDEYSNQ